MNTKTAILIQEGKVSRTGMDVSVYSQHGNFGVLDSQEIFDNEIEKKLNDEKSSEVDKKKEDTKKSEEDSKKKKED